MATWANYWVDWVHYEGWCDVTDWSGIEQVAAGMYHTLGLRSDGTVVVVGPNTHGQRDVASWSGIVQVAAGRGHTVGLRSDGTVVAVGDNDHGQRDMASWSGIVQVAAGWYHTVGLRSDGTVVAVGDNDYGQCNVASWSGIEQVAAGFDHTVGLRSDGTVEAVGRNSHGQCNTFEWDLIADWTFTVYATREGLVGQTTSNGHVIQPRDHFVALPSTKALCSNDGYEYQVSITYQGRSVVAPVWDVGPWNTKDDYWNPASEREMWQDLPRGLPEAQAACQDGYNNGFDETNNIIGLSTGTWDFNINDRVRVAVESLNVRSSSGGTLSGLVSEGDIGTVTDGPQRANYQGAEYRWWEIDWDNGPKGWSASNRYVLNPAGIDLADGIFWDDLAMTDNDWVQVEFLFLNPAPYNTPVGTDLTVILPANVVVTFEDVTTAGTTTVTTSQGNPLGTSPPDYKVRGQFVDITTTAVYIPPLIVCLPYDPVTPNPQNLKLFHWEDGHWQDVTTHVKADNHLVCGEVDSLSAFFVGEETAADGCFIATAAYGTTTAEELDTLRAFRDEVLLESTLGSQLVEWYYQVSPPVADFILEHEGLRTLVRELLIDPVAWLVEVTEAIWGD